MGQTTVPVYRSVAQGHRLVSVGTGRATRVMQVRRTDACPSQVCDCLEFTGYSSTDWERARMSVLAITTDLSADIV